MKLLKILLVLALGLNLGYAKESQKVLALAYNFASGDNTEFTEASFLAYADKFENSKALEYLLNGLFASLKDDSLAKAITNPSDLEQAKQILANLGDTSSLKSKYVITDATKTIILLDNSYILLDKNAIWDVSNTSPLYTYIAQNAKDAKFIDSVEKKSKNIEFADSDLNIIDTKDENKLSAYEPYNVYLEAYDAFYAKRFGTFTVFLDENSAKAYEDKIGDTSSVDEIVAAFGDELKNTREYMSVSNLGSCFIVFFYKNEADKTQNKLSFEFFRDIGCGIELINFASDPDPVMQDFLSR
ncbi:MAG: hypothetical protein R3Y46_02375 [Opitutales bacterium]